MMLDWFRSGLAMTLLLVSFALLWEVWRKDVLSGRARKRKQATVSLTASEFDPKKAQSVFRRKSRQRSGRPAKGASAEDKVAELKKKLRAAGYPDDDAFATYRIYEVLSALAGLAAGAFLFIVIDLMSLPLMVDLIGLFLFAAVGFSFPGKILDRRAASRLVGLEKELPNFIDLLVLCAEAGLSLDDGLARILTNTNRKSPLYDELRALAVEVSISPNREEVYRATAEKLGSKSFASLISTVLQAEKYGFPIARSLRSFSEEMRDERILAAEARAGKLPVAMTVPMMGLILPSFVVMVVSPVLIDMFAKLRGG